MKALLLVVQLLNGTPNGDPRVSVIAADDCSYEMRVVSGVNRANHDARTGVQYVGVCQVIESTN